MWKHAGLLLAAGLFCLPAGAAEVAFLHNGFSIHFARSERVANLVRLYMDESGESGYVDVSADQISSIEQDDTPAAIAAASPQKPDLRQAITEASAQTSIDPDLIESVIQAESGFNPQAVSRRGAQGLMQLMPSTAAQLGVRDSFDPQANVEGGTRYLRDLLLRYNSDLARALAAYNAGPESVSRFNGVPPYRETYTYVSRVISDFNRKKLAQRPRHSSGNKSGQASPSAARNARRVTPGVPPAADSGSAH